MMNAKCELVSSELQVKKILKNFFFFLFLFLFFFFFLFCFLLFCFVFSFCPFLNQHFHICYTRSKI